VVEHEVAGLAQPQWGHFDLGTGYHGDLWLDLDAALLSLGQARPMTERELSLPFHAAGEITSHAWPSGQCPLCAHGIALTSPSRDC
jgi:hypothetical protein